MFVLHGDPFFFLKHLYASLLSFLFSCLTTSMSSIPPISKSSLCSFSYRKLPNNVLPTPTSKVWYGSSEGWLLTQDAKNRIQLINPFLSADNVIQLTQLEGYIMKFVLSDNPAWTSNYVAMVILKKSGLAFFKSGDKSWNFLDDNQWIEFKEIIYYRDQFYAICRGLRTVVMSCDITSLKVKEVITLLGNESHDPVFLTRMYLVESSGDLLYVRKEFIVHDLPNDRDFTTCTVKFQIFKLEKAKWIEPKTIGEYAIFLGKNSSFSLNASNNYEFKPGHIYFTDDAGQLVV